MDERSLQDWPFHMKTINKINSRKQTISYRKNPAGHNENRLIKKLWGKLTKEKPISEW